MQTPCAELRASEGRPGITACWADVLSRKERAELARRLASYALRFGAAASSRKGRRLGGLHATATEMQQLRLDVTERAEVATS